MKNHSINKLNRKTPANISRSMIKLWYDSQQKNPLFSSLKSEDFKMDFGQHKTMWRNHPLDLDRNGKFICVQTQKFGVFFITN